MIDWADFFGKDAKINDMGYDQAWDDELEQNVMIGSLKVCRNGLVKNYQYECYRKNHL